jgi:hypothetical protein
MTLVIIFGGQKSRREYYEPMRAVSPPSRK